MKIINNINDLRQEISLQRQKGKTIGFVSTMGALHDGHTSLVTHAKKLSDFVVAGIFLNPSHFGPGEDFASYPRTLEKDCTKLDYVHCNLVFAPSIEEIYPYGLEEQATVEIPKLGMLHCGASRPHFFKAVATIVTKLLNIVNADIALFGEKDFQQLVICRRLVEDLNIPTTVVASPTIREQNGLAMSSRNQYLTGEQRKQAAILYQCLCNAKNAVVNGNNKFNDLAQVAKSDLIKAGFDPDYFNFANANTLEPASSKDSDIIILAAAYLNGVRLIDNITIQLHKAN